jgi:hypothetical protein
MRLLSNHDVSDRWRPGHPILRREVLNDGPVRVSQPFLIRTRWNSTSYHPPTVTANEGEILLEATAPLAARYGARW